MLQEAWDLLLYVDCTDVPDYALTQLDSLNLPVVPKYGMEPATAGVYFLEALFYYYGKHDLDAANSCLEVVLRIPEWRVIYGKQTLIEIKEEAEKMKTEINK